MKIFKTLIVILLISLSFTIQSQNKDIDKLSLNKGTIDNQFEYVIRRSNNYKEFKVVKKTWLYSLKAHTIDSLNAIHEKLKNTEKVVANQTEEIAKQKAVLNKTKSNLDSINIEKDKILLLGISLNKTSYNLLLWSTIAGLLILLLFFIYKFKTSNLITKNTKQSLLETEEEFEEHRRIALEREQKVRRQLQDEINKQKQLGNKNT